MTASKALAGAIVAVLVALLAKYGIVLGDELNAAITILVAAGIGFIGVYIAPKNKEL